MASSRSSPGGSNGAADLGGRSSFLTSGAHRIWREAPSSPSPQVLNGYVAGGLQGGKTSS